MTDPAATKMGEASSHPDSVVGASDARAAERVDLEAERFGGALQDGACVAEVASKTRGFIVVDGCFRMIEVSMRGGREASDHALALLQARTFGDASDLNVGFPRHRMSSLQGRCLEPAGLRASATVGDAVARGRA